VSGVAPPWIRADLDRRQLADVPDADPDRRRSRHLAENVVSDLPRLVDEQHVKRVVTVHSRPEVL
jgi:hypothetical protein